MVIVGPTAVGKTAVALTVAEAVGGEIVSADSRQIYRGMDIGTAKPLAAERARVRHHLIDIVHPRERYDASRFAADAEGAIEDIASRGAVAIVVGGTGFYVASLFDGLFEGPGRDAVIRARLESELERDGPETLHARLAAVDPGAATRLHPNDAVRVVRALEVYESTGTPLSAWHETGRRTPRFRAWYAVLSMERSALYERIGRRVDSMLGSGLLDEVGHLLASGRLAAGMPAADAVGYRELIPVVVGERELAGAVEEIKRNTRRYAKRQSTWFSRLRADVSVDVGVSGTDAAAAAVLAAWRAREAP